MEIHLEFRGFWTNMVKMKVKVGQLKTHLSQYLREIQETGETLEVCVRERPVAYLTPIAAQAEEADALPPDLEESLAKDGIRIVQWGRKSDFVPTPRPAGDGKCIENTIVSIREEKDW